MEVDAINADIKVEEEEREIHANLGLQYAQDIVQLQAFYKVQYKEDHYYQSLQTLAFIPKDKSALAKVYISKRPDDRIFIVYQDIQRERKRLNTLLMAMYRHHKFLD